MNGNTNDFSGNNFHGTVNGANLVPDRFGNTNSAYYFDGIDDYIDFPITSILKPTYPLTISFWANLDILSIQKTKFINTDYVADDYFGVSMNVDNLGYLGISFGGGNGFSNPGNRISFKATAVIVTTGVWYRFTGIIHSDTDMDLYIDCVDAQAIYDSGTGNTSIAYTNFAPGSLGRFDGAGPAYYFQGFMDEIMYWDRALTQAEIISLCDSMPIVLPSWDCVNGICTDPADGSGTYTDSITCVNNCVILPSWDCINDACIDPGTGNGTYASYSSCMNACIIPPSWDCINGVCTDPGTGNGIYNAYNSCLNSCITSNLNGFISGNDTICSNEQQGAEIKVSFNGAPAPYTFIYAINGVSQPSITTTANPYIINTKEGGVYTLVSVYEVDGYGSVSGQAFATIRQAPKAEFTTLTDTLSILHPTVQLSDISTGNIVAWTWDFGDNTANDFTANPFHTYKDSAGIYQLNLIVTDNFGCSDTSFKQLWIADEYWMYIPNAFTPELDGINDVFCIHYNGIREETFLFNVYNRFSELVFATKNIVDLECFLNSNENGWDGKHYRTGNDLPLGTYIYEIYFQDFEGWKHKELGHLFIIR